MTTPNAAEVGIAWRDLVIAGPKDRIDQLFAAIDQSLPPEWDRNTAAEERAVSLGVSLPSSRCYRRKLAGRDVWLWLLRVGDHRIQGGLVEPTEASNYVGDVTNTILDFRSRVLEPVALVAGLAVGSNRLGPGSLVSGSVLDALWEYCDRSRFTWPPTGDTVRDWRKFVIRAYEEHAAFDLGELSAWLTGKGWSVDHAKLLIERLIADVKLLVQYDELRQPA
jgi:hypothetical protein